MALGMETAVTPSSIEKDMGQVRKDMVVLSDAADFGWSSSDVDRAGLRPDSDGILTHIIEAQHSVPPIGNMAITDSSDVHIGTKTYIHGPVTIKQFISEVKTNENDNCHDNCAFVGTKTRVYDENGVGGVHKASNDVPVSTIDTFLCINLQKNKWPSKQTLLVIVCGIIIAAIMMAVIVHYAQKNDDDVSPNTGKDMENENLKKNIPITTDIEKVLLLSSNLRLISRLEWLAQPSGPVDPLNTPVPYVIIAHTATENCTDQASCTFQVRTIQTYHIESRSWSDIGYNYIIGGDGSAYEGRGWNTMGAHTKGYNDKSIGIGLIGTFNNVLPPLRQLNATRKLIELGVETGKISKNYKLFGHRQLIPSASPGDVLFEEIKKWDHFSENL